jgi:hypothetical protein
LSVVEAIISPSIPVPLWRRIGQGLSAVRPLDLHTGRWFGRVLTRYLRSRQARPTLAGTAAERQAASQAIVMRNAAGAALLGAATAGMSTAAAVLAAETPGGIAALPLAVGAIGLEMIARAVLHVRMSCAVADAWNVHLSAESPEDLARLYALAFDVEEPADDESGGRATIKRLAHGGDSALGNAIGSKLISESLLRNLPFIGIFTSAAESWRLTKRVGNAVTQYVHFRAAFDGLLARVAAHGCETLDALIEGVWFVCIADAQVNDDETALLAFLVQRRPPEVRERLTARFVLEPDGWIERLARVPQSARQELFRALEVTAAMRGEVSQPERAILERVAAALGIEVSADAFDRVAEAYRNGMPNAAAYAAG